MGCLKLSYYEEKTSFLRIVGNKNAPVFEQVETKKPLQKERLDYYPGGMLMPGRNYSANSYRYGHNTQEKVDEISGTGNHYTALFWEYDPRTIRRWNPDPKPDAWESVYAAFAGNPIFHSDILGDTEDERKKAVAKAKDYVNANPNKDTKLYNPTGSGKSGYKGEPGQATDCSGLVSCGIRSAGLADPAKSNEAKANELFGKSNGVSRIAAASQEVDFNNIEEGNAVTFNNNSHIGIISGGIQRDADGNVIGFNVIQSASSTGPAEITIGLQPGVKGANSYWSPKVGSAYKWDSPDKPALSNGNSASIQQSTIKLPEGYQPPFELPAPRQFYFKQTPEKSTWQKVKDWWNE